MWSSRSRAPQWCRMLQSQPGTTVVYLISRLFFLSLYQYPHVVQSQPGTTVVYLIYRLFFLSPYNSTHMWSSLSRTPQWCIFSFYLCNSTHKWSSRSRAPQWCILYLVFSFSLYTSTHMWSSRSRAPQWCILYLVFSFSLCTSTHKWSSRSRAPQWCILYLVFSFSLSIPVPTCGPVAAGHHSGVSYISSFLSLSVSQYPQVVQSQPGTTVVVQQPMQQQPMRDWNYGLFECFDDLKICCCGTFCGLCLACQVAGDMGESMCVPLCLPTIVMRTKWRADNKIQGSMMKDCLIESFCGACALCQLAREVKQSKTANTFKMS
ncbi:hypothetical protein RRG08_034075 [Elysia crispata]|uniref:Placenta-specific gene 8 protein n=1 Tax=Elysia crispata TaxID=231223 RepID=A0AAE0YKI6_9GAST|nr:hypothetical protein RRG08_034075 [Elysia crispata]